jgi:predicted secreted protein
LDGPAFTELADNQGSQSIIGVYNSPTANISRFRKCPGGQGPNNASKEFHHLPT